MKILILGVNGFIGHHLSNRILDDTSWQVFGMDMASNRVADLLDQERFNFFEGDITINKEWVEYHVKKCDLVLPLVAIATPATYVNDPLAVFELDFEANLPIIRACVRYKKRVLFPSTSEVYGMSPDAEFHPFESDLVLGPIARGEPIKLVDGGRQRRSFTDVSDGIVALMRIIKNPGGCASGQIYNIGNPGNDLSVRELAELMLDIALEFPEYRSGAEKVALIDVASRDYYGKGYQDIQTRVPWIGNTREDLHWAPKVGVRDALHNIFAAYRHEVANARLLIDG